MPKPEDQPKNAHRWGQNLMMVDSHAQRSARWLAGIRRLSDAS